MCVYPQQGYCIRCITCKICEEKALPLIKQKEGARTASKRRSPQRLHKQKALQQKLDPFNSLTRSFRQNPSLIPTLRITTS
eukprot:c24427_g1_i1 orf=34-276(-)